MAYKCVIIDDEQHAVDILTNHIGKMPELELIHASTDSIHAYQFIQQNKVDLIFLDIEMPGLNGLEFLELLNEKAKVIMTTAYKEHALEGFEHNVSDYLLKPVLFPRFLKAINRIIQHTPSSPEGKPLVKEHMFIKTGIRNKVVKINFNKIMYIESKGNYVHFHLKDENYSCLMPLKEVEKELPEIDFMRVHQSFIVRKSEIKGREGNMIILPEISLPIGESYRKGVLEYFI